MMKLRANELEGSALGLQFLTIAQSDPLPNFNGK
jgi:hypothetical protein